MDWSLIWRGLGVFVACMAVIIPMQARTRREDLDMVDGKIDALEKNINGIKLEISNKAYKGDVSRIETRFEKDIADLRADQKTGFSEIRTDIKDMRHDLMIAIRANDIRK